MNKTTAILMGALLLAATAAQAQDFSWGNAEGTLFPKAANNVNPIKELTSPLNIYYTSSTQYTNSMYSTEITLAKDGKTIVEGPQASFASWGYYLSISLPGAPFLDPGDYTITIPANSLRDAEDNVIPNPAFTHTFRVFDDSMPDYTVVPRCGEDFPFYEEISQVTLKFTNGYVELSDNPKVTVTGPLASINGKNTFSYRASLERSEDDAAIVTINLSPALLYEGEYTITIADGSIVDAAGVSMGAITLKYISETDVLAPKVTVTPEPGATLEILDEVLLEYKLEDNFYLVLYSEKAEIRDAAGKKVTDVTLTLGEDGIVTAKAAKAVNRAGEFTLVVPTGALMSQWGARTPFGEVLVAYNVTGNGEEPDPEPGEDPVVDDYAYVVTPDPAVEHEMIAGPITITFPAFESIAGPSDEETDPDIMAHFSNSPYFILGNVEGNSVSFELYEPALAKGEYTLNLESEIIGTKADGTTVTIEPFVVTFHVSGATLEPVEIKPVITPEQGVVSELKAFSITFEDATAISTIPDCAPSDYPALYSISAGGDRSKVAGSYNIITSGATLSFELVLPAPVSEPGTYQLVVPQQLLKVNSQDLEEDLVFNYEILAPEVKIPYTVEFSPENGAQVTSPVIISVEFRSPEEGVVFEPQEYGSKSPLMYIIPIGGSEEYLPGRITANGGSIVWAPYNETEEVEGELRFVIPAEYMKIIDAAGNVNFNEEIEARYMFATVVETLFGEESLEVVTLSGVKLGRMDLVTFRNLPAGIYIVGGKGVIK